ncbi:metal ABC transporter solute-binding protein, Zn/Mn family [Falsiroseomonas sp. E2-1-a4]|uniref:metal ABC transporter solute-binding protein, Zn/Mn family n=1 Tax=Falsiroseomonas sp. E2-1-a4 TaxID=3239299 RepID=UPI003F372963
MLRRTLLSLPALLLVAPTRAQAQAQATSPLVVASFSILGDMVAEIAGDAVQLRTLAGPNVDAHSFAPRPSDAQALRGAALVVRNGLGFDSWMDRMIRAAGYRGPVATATQGITPLQMDGHGHGHRQGDARQVPDPHAWQDLRFGIQYARNIATALTAALPAQAAPIEGRAAAYIARLEALDAWVRAEIAAVPEARRKVVTSHDAFGYFGAAYGITFLAPQGVSTEAEPSAAEVARLIRQIRAESITAVFMENMGNPSTLERLAREAGVAVQGRLYADALSEAAGPAASYEAMFRHNVGVLVPAMRGQAS